MNEKLSTLPDTVNPNNIPSKIKNMIKEKHTITIRAIFAINPLYRPEFWIKQPMVLLENSFDATCPPKVTAKKTLKKVENKIIKSEYKFVGSFNNGSITFAFPFRVYW